LPFWSSLTKIAGSGSVPKFHRSATLHLYNGNQNFKIKAWNFCLQEFFYFVGSESGCRPEAVGSTRHNYVTRGRLLHIFFISHIDWWL
jgi:hypothetical protein